MTYLKADIKRILGKTSSKFIVLILCLSQWILNNIISDQVTCYMDKIHKVFLKKQIVTVIGFLKDLNIKEDADIIEGVLRIVMGCIPALIIIFILFLVFVSESNKDKMDLRLFELGIREKDIVFTKYMELILLTFGIIFFQNFIEVIYVLISNGWCDWTL